MKKIIILSFCFISSILLADLDGGAGTVVPPETLRISETGNIPVTEQPVINTQGK